MLYVVEGHKFLFVAKTFHVSIKNLKMKCKMLGKCAPMSYVLVLNLFWVLNHCMMPTMRSLIYRSRHMARWL
jgi:hypothetical protein